MTLTLDSGFESDLREAVLDDVETTARDEIGPRLETLARQNWKAYAARNGYDIDHIWEDAELSVTRDDSSVSIRVEWPGLTALFEWGVDPHTIEGSPLLSFVWEGPPEGTRPPGAPEHVVADEVNWGSVTGGIPEARAIRDAIDELEGDL